MLLDAAFERVRNYKGKMYADYVAPVEMNSDNKHRPKYLVGVQYRLVNSKDMSVSEEVYDHIET